MLEETDGRCELYNGKLREKPSLSVGHNRVMRRLWSRLIAQLPEDDFDVLLNGGHTGLPNGDAYIPDVAVVPIALIRAFDSPRRFELYRSPLPLVVEVWSPSTGNYDVDAKLPGYQRRGDAEIWRIHPFERTLMAWRRQPDGRYSESRYTTGVVRPVALPGVAIDLDDLLDERGMAPGSAPS
jgi:Uma2 family endonuclease